MHNKSLGEDVNIALAEYLTAQARYIRALAERKELEVEFIKNPPPVLEPTLKSVPKKVESDMPW